MPTGTRPLPLPSTARVAISGTVFTHKWTNVFWLDVTHTDPVTVNDLQTIADAIATSWNTNVANLLTTAVSLTEVQIVFFPTSGTELVFTGAYSHPGIQGDQVHDAGASIVVDWTIGAFYRGGHPRSYIPGPRSDKVNNGSTLDAAYATSLVTAWNTLRNNINALTSTNITAVVMGTCSFVRDKAYRVAPVFFPYTSTRVRPILGSQRRRITS